MLLLLRHAAETSSATPEPLTEDLFPLNALTVEMCFGGSFRQHLLDAEPTEMWPLDDIGGDVTVVGLIRETEPDHIDNVARADTGMLPEYGGSIGFRGDGYAAFNHAAWMNGNGTSFGMSVLMILGLTNNISTDQVIAIKNFSETGQVLLWLRASGPKVEASAYIDGSQRTLSYTIPSLSDWQTHARLLVVRYTGSAFDLIQVEDDGTVTTLATAAHTGTFGTASGELVLGASSSTSPTLFFDGSLQYFAWWSDGFPDNDEITALAGSMTWTDVTEDIDDDAGVSGEWGIRNPAPMSRVASTGVWQFALDNSEKNSAATLSLYSPDHDDGQDGFALGIPVRITTTDPNTEQTRVRHLGRLTRINPRTGTYGDRLTDCTSLDYIDELARANTPTLPLVSDENSYEIIARIIGALPVTPHVFTVGEAGIESFDYGLDRTSSRTKALQDIGALLRSELGWMYLLGTGELTVRTHRERAVKTAPDWTITDADMMALSADRERDDIVTAVHVSMRPRVPDTITAVTLFTTPTLVVEYGQTITFRAPYTDPDQTDAPIGGFNLDTPTFTAVDANDVDQSANVDVDVTEGAGEATVTITHTGSVDVGAITISDFAITGKPVYSNQPLVMRAVASDEDLDRYGENLLEVDQKYQSDPARAQEAAAYLLASWGRERTQARVSVTRVGLGSSADEIARALRADVGDLVSISEDVNGFDEAHYFVNGVRTRFGGGMVETELILAPRELPSWVLGVSGYSELGVTTRLGF